MERINGSNVVVDLFGPGKNGFKDGNKALGINATIIDAEFMNAVQEELLTLIETAGLTPGVALNQILTALRSAGVFQTAAQFDNTTKAATTAFIQRALGSLSGFLSVNATSALTLAQLGRHVQIAQATPAGQIITLPALAGLASTSGNGYWFTNDSPNSVTIKANAAENINPLSANSFLLLPKETAFVMQQTNAQWNIFGAISAMNNLGLGYAVPVNRLASRAYSTSYTNTTGKPMFVDVRAISTTSTASSLGLTIDGITYQSTTVNVLGSGSQISGIVRPGGTYSVGLGGGAMNLSEWFES